MRDRDPWGEYLVGIVFGFVLLAACVGPSLIGGGS